jgi:hypothetical protein
MVVLLVRTQGVAGLDAWMGRRHDRVQTIVEHVYRPKSAQLRAQLAGLDEAAMAGPGFTQATQKRREMLKRSIEEAQRREARADRRAHAALTDAQVAESVHAEHALKQELRGEVARGIADRVYAWASEKGGRAPIIVRDLLTGDAEKLVNDVTRGRTTLEEARQVLDEVEHRFGAQPFHARVRSALLRADTYATLADRQLVEDEMRRPTPELLAEINRRLTEYRKTFAGLSNLALSDWYRLRMLGRQPWPRRSPSDTEELYARAWSAEASARGAPPSSGVADRAAAAEQLGQAAPAAKTVSRAEVARDRYMTRAGEIREWLKGVSAPTFVTAALRSALPEPDEFRSVGYRTADDFDTMLERLEGEFAAAQAAVAKREGAKVPLGDYTVENQYGSAGGGKVVGLTPAAEAKAFAHVSGLDERAWPALSGLAARGGMQAIERRIGSRVDLTPFGKDHGRWVSTLSANGLAEMIPSTDGRSYKITPKGEEVLRTTYTEVAKQEKIAAAQEPGAVPRSETSEDRHARKAAASDGFVDYPGGRSVRLEGIQDLGGGYALQTGMRRVGVAADGSPILTTQYAAMRDGQYLTGSPFWRDWRDTAVQDVETDKAERQIAARGSSDYRADIPLDVARAAHMGTSHVPDTRANQERDDYQRWLEHAKETLEKYATTPEAKAEVVQLFTAYRAGYRQHFLSHLQAKSRTLSSMIAGPSNFNVSRARKSSDAADRRTREMLDWRAKALNDAVKQLGKTSIQATGGPLADLERRVEERKRFQETAKEINKICRSKASDSEKVARMQALGASLQDAKSYLEPDFAGRLGVPDYKLSNNRAELKRLEARLESERGKQALVDMPATEHAFPASDLFPAGYVELLPDEDRLRVRFPGRVSRDAYEEMKAHGFRSMHSIEGAFSRNLTDNTIATVNRMFGLKIPNLSP